MKRVFSFLAAAFLALASFTAAAQDATRASEAEAQAMVKKAIEFYKKNGKDKALAEFMKKPGPFVDRDLYVTVYTMNADSLAAPRSTNIRSAADCRRSSESGGLNLPARTRKASLKRPST